MGEFQGTITNVSLEEIQTDQIVGNALNNKFPFVFWRKPQADRFHLSIALQEDTVLKEYQLESLESGFLFRPFEENSDHENHFIKNDILLEFRTDSCTNLHTSPHVSQDDIQFLLEKSENPAFADYYTSDKNPYTQSEEHENKFIQLVERSIDQIKNGAFHKVVPSRINNINLPNDFDPIHFFKKLEQTYPNAFVYLICLPDAGTWIGATPENLISVEENKIFKTTALAGTQKYEEGMRLVDAAWRQKEIEEQALVCRYIINCFKKIRLREFEEIGPRTMKAGNLIHLKTDYIVNMEEVNFPQLGSVMLELLHPTSAVCGMPKDPALKFIKENEGFDRSYFSGFLGPVATKEQTNLFVNLRCMKLNNDHSADIYAGAGVTIDSVPEKEWLETEMKMETLLKLM
mgnify:CR=1 FL=1